MILSTSPLARPGWQFAWRQSLFQALLVGLGGVASFFGSGYIAVASVFLGGLSLLLPTLLFAAIAFRYSGARSAAKTVQAFKRGESLKIILSATAIGSLLISKLFVPEYVLLGAGLALLATLLAPICIKQQ